MNKKVAIIVVVLVAIAAAWYFVINQQAGDNDKTAPIINNSVRTQVEVVDPN